MLEASHNIPLVTELPTFPKTQIDNGQLLHANGLPVLKLHDIVSN